MTIGSTEFLSREQFERMSSDRVQIVSERDCRMNSTGPGLETEGPTRASFLKFFFLENS